MSDTEVQPLAALLDTGSNALSKHLLPHLKGPWSQRGDETGAEPDADATARGYDFEDEALAQAAVAALILGQPLILAGEPGVGKTQFAAALAGRLGLTLQPTYRTKTATVGRDLLYVFDEVARFRDATGLGVSRRTETAATGEAAATRPGTPGPKITAESAEPSTALCKYVRFTALGRAILWSAGPDALVSPHGLSMAEVAGRRHADKQEIRLQDLFPREFVDRSKQPHAQIDRETRSVALIDEFDKAPRDAPNDILGELESMSFQIDELGIDITAGKESWPVLLITSNSERSLPDAFLRRCVFHWIEFPTETRLMRIVASHCARTADGEPPLSPSDELLRSAVRAFTEIRKTTINKPPATAELIAFVLALLHMGYEADESVDLGDPRVDRILGVLLKTRIDLDRIREGNDGR